MGPGLKYSGSPPFIPALTLGRWSRCLQAGTAPVSPGAGGGPGVWAALVLAGLSWDEAHPSCPILMCQQMLLKAEPRFFLSRGTHYFLSRSFHSRLEGNNVSGALVLHCGCTEVWGAQDKSLERSPRLAALSIGEAQGQLRVHGD